MDNFSVEVVIHNLSKWSTAMDMFIILIPDLIFVVTSLQRAEMSDFDRYKVMKAKRMVSACLIPADHETSKVTHLNYAVEFKLMKRKICFGCTKKCQSYSLC